MQPLSDLSPIVADAAAKMPATDIPLGTSAGEWLQRRVRLRRLDNRKVRCPVLSVVIRA
jgi:hypothetical protein